MPPSFSIVRIGIHTLEVDGLDEPWRVMVTLIRSGASGGFSIFHSDGEFPTLEQAQAHAARHGGIEWRDSTKPLPDEQPCWLCGCTMGRPLEARERHPQRICQVCALEAVDAGGRSVCFGNVDVRGGFRGWYADTRAPYDRHDCIIRGVACQAHEARFGGIVIEPILAVGKA